MLFMTASQVYTENLRLIEGLCLSLSMPQDAQGGGVLEPTLLWKQVDVSPFVQACLAPQLPRGDRRSLMNKSGAVSGRQAWACGPE